MENLQSLIRIDIYNNRLEGSIESLTKSPVLEILHVKNNMFSGPIPSSLGDITKKVTWIDLSENFLVGTLPSSLASLSNLVDLRLGDNRLSPNPIPGGLCMSTKINGGLVTSCDHILCPVGTFSDSGFATAGKEQCEPCEEGATTIYSGQSSCSIPTATDFIELFYSAIYGFGYDIVDDDNVMFETEDECDWEGVQCDDEDSVTSIEFALSNIEFDEDLFKSRSTKWL